MARVEHIFVSVAHKLPMREVEEIQALVGEGLEGCAHARQGSRRQVLLMDGETLDELGVAPGAVKENITTRGLTVASLERGRRLRIGEALLEVTLACEPCRQMAGIRPGLDAELRGRRGMLCRVLQGGRIRRGDAIEVLAAVPA
jgi:MOSC domain-containing protein YiiM